MAYVFSPRSRDMVYLTFFVIHIPVMLMVDLLPLYPEAFKPQVLLDVRAWYINTYQDRFFIGPPAWFDVYLWMEALYHLPLSVWMIGALLRDDVRAPLHLMIYSVQTAVTTLTCIADYLSWDVSGQEKASLSGLYVPYLVLSLLMGVDMFGRLSRSLSAGPGSKLKAG